MGASSHFRKKRYIAYIITTILIMLIPFLSINGNQIFLLSFDKKQLHLLGVMFDMQELYLMPFLLIMLFVGIFLLTTLAGRAWCGWACPHTIFRVIYRDIIETKIFGLHKRIDNKQQPIDLAPFKNKIKKLLAIGLWAFLCFIAACNFMLYFVPPSDFFPYLSDYSNHKILLTFLAVITLFLTLEIAFVAENFCIYMCPYCRVQSVLYDNDTQTVIYDQNRGGAVYKDGILLKKGEFSGECVACNKCVRVCPTHIDIRKGLQLECINCLECADACEDIMGAQNKPSLIHWSSTNAINALQNLGLKARVRYFRPKTIGYIAVLVCVFGIALYLGSSKSTMLLDVNRTTESYKILESGNIENHYIMMFQNTQNKAHDFYLKIVGNDNITVSMPSKPFRIEAGKRAKKRVFLESKNNANSDIVPIQIMAYAIDDENISVIAESIFIYPK